MPRSGFAGAVTCTPCVCSRSITSFQLEPSAQAPCTRTTVGWDPSCWFSLTPSSLVEGSEAELLRLALLCEGTAYTVRGGGTSPRSTSSRVNVSFNGPRTSENSVKAKFEVHAFHEVTRYSAVCAAHPQGNELPRIL